MTLPKQLLLPIVLVVACSCPFCFCRVRTRTKPTTQPSGEKSPQQKLVSACRAKAKTLTSRLDKSFNVTVHAPFVIAGNMPGQQLDNLARRSVLAPAQAMWKSYFTKKPDRVVTVLLFKNAASYRFWTRKLFNDRDLPHFGYYRSADRTLVMNISTGSGTLVHELTHALIDFDFADVPTWFNEGLASLHEQCVVAPDKITGLTNWRLPALKKALSDGTLRPLRQLVTKRDFYGLEQGLNYAQARYFCMYMQKLGLLQKFYRYFRKHHLAVGADVQAVEHIFGKKIEMVQNEYRAWIKTLQPSR